VSPSAELLLFLYAESPVHAGASDSLDVIDLPVQREAATTYPVIWGQSLKGALRQAAEDDAETGGSGAGGTGTGGSAWTSDLVRRVFGRAVDAGQDGAEAAAGLLSVGDAQLVAMPVPTLRKTFAWVTSELALGRLSRKYRTLHVTVPQVPSVAADSGLAARPDWVDAGQVLGPCVLPLEQAGSELPAWAERLAEDAIGPDVALAYFHAKLREDLLFIGSDAMPLLLRECTELSARVQLTSGKTVENGPFYSEYLPAETILAASLTLRGAGEAELAALRRLFGNGPLQVGGDETLGKGLVWPQLVGAVR
jgi:CRISPR-associated protein Cmr4